ncbi:MAG: hypothetical protein MR512_04575, partial [Anaerococcus sp.]|nr:hypothetical protein [Anaerococcus sp.]
DDTKISAKDEDGKDIPVEIDENGNVIVTPGTDVDGPITVTIEDPDLPSGKVEIEVPVEGHEDGRDDNNSDKTDDKTSVDAENVKPVDPTDQEQETGIVITNPDDDTKVSAKDEDGNDVPVVIDENGNVIVTPGTNVDGPITVTIEDPDLPGGKVEIEVPVEGHEKGRDDNNSDKTDDKTQADEITPIIPAEKTEVADKENLTDAEKAEIKDKVEKANKDNFPEGTKVEIGNDGSVTITYPDGSVDVIDGKDLVVEKDKESTLNKVTTKKSNNPKTGVAGSIGVASILAAASAGLFASKKRKDK